MSAINPDIDRILENFYYEIYRYNFLLTGHGVSAKEVTFQTFLYMGDEKRYFFKITRRIEIFNL
ncbi:hypothetical protein P261_00957 [Lachnospiraceae bacterium TWA4]|nr:hypothetical protein P261_00957 [Lachnospiraceae bacterium TWA4]